MNKPGNFKRLLSCVLVMLIGFFSPGSLFSALYYPFRALLSGPLVGQAAADEMKQLEKAKKEFERGQYTLVRARCERMIGILTEQKRNAANIFGQCYILLGAVMEKQGKKLLAKEYYLKARDTYHVKEAGGVKLDGLEIYRKIMFTVSAPENGRKKKKQKKRWPVIVGSIITGGLLFFTIVSE